MAAFCLFLNIAKAQVQTDTIKSTKFKIEEIDFVGSYYNQDGNNSAVTGGKGTEKLDAEAINLSLKLVKHDKKKNKHTLDVGIDVDGYTSASSDNIDPGVVTSASGNYMTSASRSDVRFAPSAGYLFENTKSNYTMGGGLAFSAEFDYTSLGGNISFSKSTKDKNRELSANLSVFLDTWKVILPIELRPQSPNLKYKQGDSAPRNSYNLGLGLMQVVNPRLHVSILADIGYQTGLLGTAYQRVYFADNGDNPYSEKLPDNRFKLPIGVRANYFLGDRVIIRSFYRYYTDSWKMKAHTGELEVPYKITPLISVAPFYRFHSQSAVDYFKPYKEHTLTEEYYTSDYDLSKFTSHLFGVNFRMVSAEGLFGIKPLNTLELRYSYYDRSAKLTAHLITLALKFK